MTGAYPPSKEAVDALVARFDEATLRGNSTWPQEDMALMVRAYRYQTEVIESLRDRLDVAQKEHREEMRDAGAEMRDLMSELNASQRAAEGW